MRLKGVTTKYAARKTLKLSKSKFYVQDKLHFWLSKDQPGAIDARLIASVIHKQISGANI